MFQPRAKLEFVRRYCSPRRGWRVCVDIDPSEKGITGGTRKTKESRERQLMMQSDWAKVSTKLESLGVQFGNRQRWHRSEGLPGFAGDPDILAYDKHRHEIVVAEVEAESAGQPEQKLYKAVGQIIRSVSRQSDHWHRHFVIVVHGDEMARHLAQFTALAKISIFGLCLAVDQKHDRLVLNREAPRLLDTFAHLV